MMFNEVSNPFLEQCGFPDQTLEFELENKNYVQYYYYNRDIVIEFVCPNNKNANGWEISFALSLDPLKYFKNKEDNEQDHYGLGGILFLGIADYRVGKERS